MSEVTTNRQATTNDQVTTFYKTSVKKDSNLIFPNRSRKWNNILSKLGKKGSEVIFANRAPIFNDLFEET